MQNKTIVFDELNIGNEVTNYIGDYMGILSSEYWLLKYHNKQQSPEFKAVLNEIYFV